VVHEGDNAVGGHWTGVKTGGSQQRRDVQRHRALGGVQDEQFAPGQPQQRHLAEDRRNIVYWLCVMIFVGRNLTANIDLDGR